MNAPRGSRSQRDWQAIGAASGIGCTVVVSLLVCIGGGILLDRWLGIEPIGVLVGMVLGLIAAAYSLYELAVLGQSDKGVVRLDRSDNNSDADGEIGRS